MASYDLGKSDLLKWIRKNFSTDSEILDVGACDGKYRQLLFNYPNMDAVEVFEPNANAIKTLYRNTYCLDISEFQYNHYDLIIFGDVIEHMEVSKAKKVLQYATRRCHDMIVSVPFLYPQGELYGNPWERHIQDDLTPELFEERYPGFEPLIEMPNYCYYHKKEGKEDAIS